MGYRPLLALVAFCLSSMPRWWPHIRRHWTRLRKTIGSSFFCSALQLSADADKAVGLSVDEAEAIVDDVRKVLRKKRPVHMALTGRNQIPLLINGTVGLGCRSTIQYIGARQGRRIFEQTLLRRHASNVQTGIPHRTTPLSHARWLRLSVAAQMKRHYAADSTRSMSMRTWRS